MLTKALEKLLRTEVSLVVCVDSKDMFETLSTCHGSMDKNIRADVVEIKYEFETRNVKRMIWISGKINLSDRLTKYDSPLATSLRLLFFNG